MVNSAIRILLINSEFPPVGGGASNASGHVAEIWAEEGHQVVVLTAQFGELAFDEVVNGVRVVRIRAGRKRIDRSSPIEQIAFMVNAVVQAVRLGRNWRPDVTVAYFGVPSGPAALLLKWLWGIPYVVSLRGGDVPGFRSYDFGLYHRLVSPVLHLIWRQAERVVANSEGLRKLAQAFDSEVAVEVIPNGVDADRWHVEAREWDPAVILTVGRLVGQKGIDVLLHGLADIRDLPWELQIVGDGKDREKLEALSAALGLGDRVQFAGWKHRSELLDYYRRANLYLHTSFDEGMSNAVLEAMACGLPVLGTGISGNVEVIVPGLTGELIPPGDPAAVSAALRRWLPDAGLRERYGAAGRDRVAKEYTWEKTAREYLEICADSRS